MKTRIPTNLIDNQVQHRHGGGGWVIVQDLKGDMCRVTNFSKDAEGKYRVGTQAFLAWVKLLSPWMLILERGQPPVTQTIPEGVQVELDRVRNGLATGDLVVNNTRITAKS